MKVSLQEYQATHIIKLSTLHVEHQTCLTEYSFCWLYILCSVTLKNIFDRFVIPLQWCKLGEGAALNLSETLPSTRLVAVSWQWAQALWSRGVCVLVPLIKPVSPIYISGCSVLGDEASLWSIMVGLDCLFCPTFTNWLSDACKVIKHYRECIHP